MSPTVYRVQNNFGTFDALCFNKLNIALSAFRWVYNRGGFAFVTHPLFPGWVWYRAHFAFVTLDGSFFWILILIYRWVFSTAILNVTKERKGSIPMDDSPSPPFGKFFKNRMLFLKSLN